MSGKVIVQIEIDERVDETIYSDKEKLDFINVIGFRILKHNIKEAVLKKMMSLTEITQMIKKK